MITHNMDEEHFDAVIIGSGFGGSVMAYRLAEANLRVCLLERGKAYPPNSFPRAPHPMRNNFWDPSEGLYGMFNIWSFKGSGALVSSGLGGGSLIYANILIRKDPAWFKEDLPAGGYIQWPVQYADLESHYGEVEKMMNVQKYPLRHPPYNLTAKTLAMREAAQKLNPSQKPGLSWIPLNLAVSFRTKAVSDPDEDDSNNPPLVGEPIQEAHRNIHNMTRYTCRLCGECDIGCNYGSKNTLDYNYISEAQRLHAEIRSLCEVKKIAPRGGGSGFTVTYIKHDPERLGGYRANTDDEELFPCFTITCDRLILSAGAFGTPYLLMRSHSAFSPPLSEKLGSKFSLNGDLLSFIVQAKAKQNGKMVARPLNPSFGPVITSAIRYGDTLDGEGEQGRGFYVEDGGNPYLLSWLSEISGITGYLRRFTRFIKINLKYRLGLSQDTDMGAEIAELLGECVTSSSSMPVLTMGRDYASGLLKLSGKYLDCDWHIRESQQYYDRVEREVRKIAEVLNAKYMENPSFRWNFQQVLTAHPLGGCPMGRNKDEGVVDSYGEVFDHPGLYVVDGSIMPGPVGPNPSLTIAAISNRAADHIIIQKQRHGR